MQTRPTIHQLEPARLITFVASTVIAAILIVAFVLASVGLGSEGRARPGPMPAPQAMTSH